VPLFTQEKLRRNFNHSPTITSYNPNVNATLYRSPSAIINPESPPKQSEKSFNGPGDYSPKYSAVRYKAPSALMTCKRELRKQQLPAPGQYSPNDRAVRPKSPSVLFKSPTNYSRNNACSSVGPGSYNTGGK